MAKKKVFSIGSSLAESLEETFEAAQNNSGALYVEVLPLSKIEIDIENPRDLALMKEDISHGISRDDVEFVRKSAELESLQSLANSISSQGLINPITVYKYGDKYRLIAGERRTLASVLAGKQDIQARILSNRPDRLKISLLQWIENIEREGLSLWERLKNLEKIITAYAELNKMKPEAVSVMELGQLLGCSKSQAAHYKTVLADEILKNFIFENKIMSLEKAAILASIEDQTMKHTAIQVCIDGASLKQLKLLANQKPVKMLLETKLSETRGRQATTVHLGATKNMSVAKIIWQSLMENKDLSHLAKEFQSINWEHPRAVTETFKRLLQILESLHA